MRQRWIVGACICFLFLFSSARGTWLETAKLVGRLLKQMLARLDSNEYRLVLVCVVSWLRCRQVEVFGAAPTMQISVSGW